MITIELDNGTKKELGLFYFNGYDWESDCILDIWTDYNSLPQNDDGEVIMTAKEYEDTVDWFRIEVEKFNTDPEYMSDEKREMGCRFRFDAEID